MSKQKNNLLALTLWLLCGIALARPASESDARPNDVAQKYVLETNGDFFRVVEGRRCQITTNVLSFKIPSHSQDDAVAYYLKDENAPNLFRLRNSQTTGACPAVEKSRIFENVAKNNGEWMYYPTKTAKAVLVALDTHGGFVARDGREIIDTRQDVDDFSMYSQYEVASEPMSDIFVFLIDRAGFVLRMKGRDPKGSVWGHDGPYNSLEDFRRRHKLK